MGTLALWMGCPTERCRHKQWVGGVARWQERSGGDLEGCVWSLPPSSGLFPCSLLRDPMSEVSFFPHTPPPRCFCLP